MANSNNKKIKKYSEIGFDAFLYRGPGSRGSEALTLGDIDSGKTSALRQNSQTEKIDLGQSGNISVSDGKNVRFFIGTR